ncbi:hypothetical protein JaAD80_28665 [Janthinobacterium sp. AD80]|nr:hypothetical protein JaAD80_28665 [Janthinobacterium sp. AD80]
MAISTILLCTKRITMAVTTQPDDGADDAVARRWRVMLKVGRRMMTMVMPGAGYAPHVPRLEDVYHLALGSLGLEETA